MIDPTLSSAIVFGSLIGIMCVGLTLTYLTTKVPNFAHSDFVALGVFVTFTSFILTGTSAYEAIPVGFVTGSAAAIVMYLLVLRPLVKRSSSIVVLMIATLAVSIMFTGLVPAYADYLNSRFGRLILSRGYDAYSILPLPDFSLFGEHGLLIVAPGMLVSMTAALYLLLTRTKFGIAMRASIESPSLATILGINVERVTIFSWFLAGGLAGLAGSLYILQFPGNINVSSGLVVSVFAGSILGGLGSIYGAIVGGLVVGAGEILITSFLSRVFGYAFGSAVGAGVLTYQKGIPLLIMIISLLIIPNGLVSVNWRRLRRRSK